MSVEGVAVQARGTVCLNGRSRKLITEQVCAHYGMVAHPLVSGALPSRVLELAETCFKQDFME